MEVKNLRAALSDGTEVNARKLALAITPAFSQDISQLTFGDFWVAAAWLRVNSFSNNPLIIVWECPQCQSNNKTQFDFTSIELNELPDDYKEPAAVALPISKDVVQLRLSRLKDETRVLDFLKDYIVGRDPSPGDVWLGDIAATISNKRLSDAYEYVTDLEPSDVLHIEQYQDMFHHGLPDRISATCDKKDGGCGYVTERLRFNFLAYDILPGRIPKDNYRETISFGDES